MKSERLQNKLRTMVEINSESECWEWLGQISNSGHGRISIRDQQNGMNSMMSAATASYIAFNSDVPEGKIVRQTCANRLCINPQHLEVFQLPE